MNSRTSPGNRPVGRNRALVGAAGVLLVLLAGSVVATAALSRIRALDDTVESLEQRLVDLSLLVARNEDVAQAFSAISAQHSSAWTHEEINDRLRHEIDRLARRVPEAPAAEAAPDYLVQIPRLEEAILTEAGSGYREYRIDLDTAPVDLPGVVLFLKRLQESPQALRVDELELRRKPLDTWVTPGIGITRTVVNWPPEDAAPKPEETLPSIGVNLVRNPSFERWDEHAAMPHDWLAQGCRVEQAAEYASEGTWCLRAEAVEAGAAVWQRHALKPGVTYELRADIAATGEAWFAVLDDAAGNVFEHPQPVRGDGMTYRYRARFTMPADAQGAVAVRAPAIMIDAPGTVVYVDNAFLGEVLGD